MASNLLESWWRASVYTFVRVDWINSIAIVGLKISLAVLFDKAYKKTRWKMRLVS